MASSLVLINNGNRYYSYKRTTQFVDCPNHLRIASNGVPYTSQDTDITPPNTVENMAPHLPKKLQELLTKMLDKDPRNRPDVTEVQAVLKQVESGS